jgi:hypothetical protein
VSAARVRSVPPDIASSPRPSPRPTWVIASSPRRTAFALALALGLALTTHSAHADRRPVHGSIGGGSALLLSAHDGDRWRYELSFDVEPVNRYGGFLAWRGFDGEHKGMLLGGVVFEAGAARPRLVLALHGDVGADLDQRAPVVGGGIRTTLTLWGPIGVAFDSGAYLVVDGIEHTRLRLMGSTSLVARW